MAKFRRSDGVEMEAAEGSAAFEIMSRDGAFTRLNSEGEAVPAAAETKDTGTMKKSELLAYAAERGIEVSPKATVAAIRDVIQKAEQKPAESGDEEK